MTTVGSSGSAGEPGSFPDSYDDNSGSGMEDASSQDAYSRVGYMLTTNSNWADGGPTDLDNLILLCGFHHRFVHEHGWTIHDQDGKPVFAKPDGQAYPPPNPELHPRLRELVGLRT